MKALSDYIQESLEHVICRDSAGNWRIKGHPGQGNNTDVLGYWKAKYKTKKDAEAALRGYFASKNESLDNSWTVYLDGHIDDNFTKRAKNWRSTPKIGETWYAGGAIFKIVKINGNNVYVKEDN